MIVEKSRVLAIGAHADDIEYGCGGVLAAAKVAMGITVCSVNEEHREAEAFSAGEILGSETVFLNQKKSIKTSSSQFRSHRQTNTLLAFKKT